jgi:hypothetical protein
MGGYTASGLFASYTIDIARAVLGNGRLERDKDGTVPAGRSAAKDRGIATVGTRLRAASRDLSFMVYRLLLKLEMSGNPIGRFKESFIIRGD